MAALLGLDLGEKRVGVAVTDEAAMLATPLKTLPFEGRKKFLKDLEPLIEDYRVSKVIVGLPKTLKGEIGPAAQKIMAHVEWFQEHVDLPWEYWDERLTTQEAERVLLEADLSRARRKEVRDAIAAQRILQNYLDFHRRG